MPALVAGIVDGRSLRLASGQEVRLSAVVVDGAESRSASTLRALSLGRPVTLYPEPTEPDRHRRIVAHAVLDDGTWLQQALISAGLARVYPAPGETGLAAPLLASERDARLRRAGLWADARFRVRNPDDTWNDRDSFQIVEGRVVASDIVGGRGYVNFGEDWRRDFTASLDRRALRAFRREGVDILALAGRRLRVRGWVHLRNGPMIDLTDPSQMELLGED